METLTQPTQHNFNNLTGKRFFRLIVTEFAGRTKSGKILWKCLCDCGESKAITASNLITGHSQSCGCFNRQRRIETTLTHGESRNKKASAELRAFQTAKQRCENPKNAAYARYGGRGIEFRFTDFADFLSSVGRKPSVKHSLDREDNNGHYEPGNVRWATSLIQNTNRRNNIFFELNGERRTESDWCDILQIKRGCVSQRIKLRWCVQCALTLPKGESCSHRSAPDRWTARRENASK